MISKSNFYPTHVAIFDNGMRIDVMVLPSELEAYTQDEWETDRLSSFNRASPRSYWCYRDEGPSFRFKGKIILNREADAIDLVIASAICASTSDFQISPHSVSRDILRPSTPSLATDTLRSALRSLEKARAEVIRRLGQPAEKPEIAHG